MAEGAEMTNKQRRKILVLVIAIVFATGTSAFALPHVDKVVRGDVDIKTEEAKMTINASSGSIINYSSFDILENESVFVTLPTVNSKILNRVTGNDPSDLLGNLNCNGLFILVNESGIHVGPDAKINVGSIILSTRDISDSNFINGDYLFKKFSKEELDMLLLNEGHITISDGGFGVLIAGAVENRGIITARAGRIVLAGGDAIKLEIASGGLISVAIEEGVARTIVDAQGDPITDQIKNTGTLKADGGMVILKAESITDIFRNAINLEGYISATRVEEKDGEVRLITSGDVRVDAEVEATRIVIGDEAEAVPENVALEGGRLEAEESVRVLSNRDIKVNNIIKTQEGDIVLFADHDKDGVGEFTQGSGRIEAKGEGDIYIDGSGDMTIGELKTGKGDIRIGETVFPDRIIGLPGIVHAQGRYLEVTAHEFYINSESRTTHLIKPEGSLLVEEVVHMDGEDLVALGFGDSGEVEYLEKNNITLEVPRGDINTAGGVIIPGNQVKLSARGIGSYDHPVGINADITYINRIQGDIDVSGMWGLGTSICIRGPAPSAGSDSWGAVSYNSGSHLVLEAEKVTLTGPDPTYLLGNITFHNLEVIIPNKEVYFEAGKTYTFEGNTHIEGAYGEHVKLLSSEEGTYWYINPQGKLDISYAWVEDSYNLAPQEIIMVESTNRGNCVGWDPLGYWTGATDNFWSIPGNWTGFGGALPGAGDDVVFDAANSMNDVSIVDAAFGGSIGSLSITDYTGTITLERNLTITTASGRSGNYTQTSGTFNETEPFDGSTSDQNTYSLTVEGTFSQTGGIFRGATGGTAEAVRIADVNELQAIETTARLSESYVQYGNIDASATSGWNGGAGFDPIGDSTNRFTGTYNGNNYTISDLTINRPGSTFYIALFGYARNTTIQNVGLTNVNITGGPCASLIGYVDGFSDIINCYVTGEVRSLVNIGTMGGLIASVYWYGSSTSNITNCYSEANVTANDASTGASWVGGLIGYGLAMDLTDSYATGDVTCAGRGGNVGGLAGTIGWSTVTNCYATGDITVGDDPSNIGGLVGQLHDSTFTNGYATGEVISGYSSGSIGGAFGFAGYGDFTNIYATGNVTVGNAGERVGGLFGYSYGYGTRSNFTNCYATGNVTAGINSASVGGLGGYIYRNASTITDSYSVGNVTAGDGSWNIGGLVGWGREMIITDSYATGQVEGGDNSFSIGGLVGYSGSITMSTSYATGHVKGGVGSRYLGGLVGSNNYQSITNCYARGDVTGENNSYAIGGLIGINLNYSVITNSYSVGKVSGGTIGSYNIGGLVGENTSADPVYYTSNYWDTETSGWSGAADGIGNRDFSGQGVDGLTTAQLRDKTNLIGWDFTTPIWVELKTATPPDYPHLYWEWSTTIYTLLQLQNMRLNLGVAYTLGNDIDATATIGWNGGLGFEPIGDDTTPFTGSFNGDGYTVSDLYINRDDDYVGLFGLTDGATIENVGLTDVDIAGDGSYAVIGGLVGYAAYTTITDCYVTGEVSGGINTNNVGGLVGFSEGSDFATCHFSGVVDGGGSDGGVGGLIGCTDSSSIIDSYSTGEVTGVWDVGGLVGFNATYSFITDSYSTAQVTGDSDSSEMGGLVGENSTGCTITDSYATGQVTAGERAGGLIGANYDSDVMGSYATGDVIIVVGGDSEEVGGLIGRNMGSGFNIIDSYATGDVNGIAGSVSIGGLIGRNASGAAITNGYATGNVTVGDDSSNIGGLVGLNVGSSTITNSYAAGNVISGDSSYRIGGLVGSNQSYGKIENSYAAGQVETGADGISIGGLAGENVSDCTIARSYATGDVTGGDNTINIGGLLGYQFRRSSVTDCYATGDVTGLAGAYNIGGLVGYEASSVTNSYSAGGVNGGVSNIGGFAGIGVGTYTACFWDNENSGQSRGVGNGAADPPGVTGLTTSQMRNGTNFTGWDFYGLWKTVPGDYHHIVWEGMNNGSFVACTERYPYLIDDTASNGANELQFMKYDLDANYVMVSDVDASITSSWGGGVGFDPAGDSTTAFTGSFDGQNHTISSLYINRPAEDRIGLFGYTNGASTQDVGLININVTGNNRVGGLAGYNEFSSITNSYVTGSVMGNGDSIGGLVGYNTNDSSITNSFATGSVVGNGQYTGGLVGENENSSIINSYAAGSVAGGVEITGGLVGYNWRSTITNSYATGPVMGVSEVGGLVGHNFESPITDSYAMGNVAGDWGVGGLAGSNYRSSVTNSYAIGYISGNSDFGGLIGYDGNDDPDYYTANFWNTETSGLGGADDGIGNRSGAAWQSVVTGKTTTQMMQRSTFETSGWDFASTWEVVEVQTETFPYHQWRYPAGANAVSGIGYDSVALDIGPNVDIALAVEGTRLDTGLTYANGFYYFLLDQAVPVTQLNSGDAVLTYIDNYAIKGNSVTVVGASGVYFSVNGGLNLYENTLAVRHEAAGTVTKTVLLTAHGSIVDPDIIYSISSIDVNGDFLIMPSTTFAPGDDMFVEGSWTNLGTFTAGTYTVTFDGALTGKTITSGGSDFYDIVFNGATGEWTISDAMNVGNDFTLTNGSVIQSGNVSITHDYYQAAGSFSCPDPATYSFSVGNSFSLADGAIFNRFTGAGTALSPYLIYDVYGLQAMKSYLSANYALNNDIDASSTVNWNGGDGFEPVGDDINSFTGSFDGDEYEISDLYINRAENFLGLFGYTDGVTILDVGMVDVDITGRGTRYNVGGLVGHNYNSPITNCYVTGEVSVVDDGHDVGGLIGHNEESTIINCHSTADVTGGTGSTHGSGFVGGLIGNNDSSSLTDCYATGDVIVGDDSGSTGGLVGYNHVGSTITDCYATGDVTSDSNSNGLGGLVGQNRNSAVTDSYATGDVSADTDSWYIGGLIGTNYYSTITRSHATGDVEGRGDNVNSIGGLIGYSYFVSIVTECYATGDVIGGDWNENIGGLVGRNENVSAVRDSYATGFVTSGINSFNIGGLVGFNYSVWAISDSYATGDVVGGDGSGYIGGLVGWNWMNSTIRTCYAEGNVTGDDSSSYIGGLVGYNSESSTITTNCYATGNVTGGSSVGGLVGSSKTNSSITQSYATGEVVGRGHTGGLVGSNNGSTITDSYATGQVTSGSASQHIGGLVGYNRNTATITNCHATGNVIAVDAHENIGGLVGRNERGSSITDSYATGGVTGGWTNNVGGLVGMNWDASIVRSHATGDVTCGDNARNIGGLAGRNYIDATITQSHATGNVTVGDDAQSIGGLAGSSFNNASISDSYATGNVASGDGSQYVGGLVGTNADATLTQSYALGEVTSGANSEYVGGLIGYNYNAPVSYSYATRGVTVGNSSSYIGGLIGYSEISDITNSYAAGEVTVGDNFESVGGLVGHSESTSIIEDCYFVGEVTGGITGDYIGGLVGYTKLSGEIKDCYTNTTVTAGDGSRYIGGLAGYMQFGPDVTDCYAIATVTGGDNSNGIGGLAGYVFFGPDITNSYAIVTVTGGDNSHSIGGLVGSSSWSNNINCYSKGQVIGGNNSYYVGGLIGVISIAGSQYCYSTATVTSGDNSIAIGGLVGVFARGLVWNSYATGEVTAGDNSQHLGGLIGWNFDEGGVRYSYATGDVTGGINSMYLGGLIGGNDAINTEIISSYAMGHVTGGSGSDYLGGLIGYIWRDCTITDSYAIGYVSGGSTYMGGLVGYDEDNDPNDYTANFWNTETSGLSGVEDGIGNRDFAGQGVDGRTTIQMMRRSTFEGSGWDFGTIWEIVETQLETFPYHQWRYPSGANAISGITYNNGGNIGPNVDIALAINGTDFDATYTYANGFYYFLLDQAVPAEQLNPGDAILTYIPGITVNGNSATILGDSGVYYDTNGSLNIYGGALAVRHEEMGTITNEDLKDALGNLGILHPDDIIFSVSSPLDVNGDFIILPNTTFAPGDDVFVEGSWTNYGTFTADSFTVTFDGTDTGKTITPGGSSFYNLVIASADGNGEWSLGGDMVVLNSLYLTAGTLDASTNNYPITVGRSWINSGTFVPREGTVTFDSLLDSLISGDTVFYNLTCEIAGKNLIFGAASNQTVLGTLTLEGAPGNLLNLSSTVPGIRFTFTVSRDEVARYVDVRDSQVSNTAGPGAPWDIFAVHSKDSGNTDRFEPSPHWDFGPLYLEITGNPTMEAGSFNELTITAYDYNTGLVAASYDGDWDLVFSGLGVSPLGYVPEVEGTVLGSVTTIPFTNGVSDSDSATLQAFKAESATLDVTDGTYNSYTLGHYGLDLTVYPAAANQLLWVKAPHSPVNSGDIWPACSIEVADMYGNRRTNDTNPITVNPSNLGGTLTQGAVNGLAIFDDLKYTTKRTAVLDVKGTSPGLIDTEIVKVTVNREKPKPPEPPVPPEPPEPPQPPEPIEPTGFDDMTDIVNVLKYKKWYDPGKYRTSVIVYEGRVVAAPYTEDGPELEKGVSLTPGEETKIEGTVPEGKAGTRPRKLTVRKTAEGEIEFTPYDEKELKEREETKRRWEEEGLKRELH